MTGPTFFEGLITDLEDYARHQQQMSRPVSDKSPVTVRESLKQVEEQTGKTPQALLDEPELHPAVHHVWCWYCDIKATGSMTYAEIGAWARLKGTQPKPWEIDALRRVNAIMETPND